MENNSTSSFNSQSLINSASNYSSSSIPTISVPPPANGNGIPAGYLSPPRSSIPGKHCWVCFSTDEDEFTSPWVSPCRCRGTAKWVHQECLQRWVDEKQQGSSEVKVNCPQCHAEYLIVYPRQGPLLHTLDLIERLLNRSCPFLAGGILVGSVYWTAVTYGAVTIMQILGHKEGLSVMEKADPLFLLIGLPTIPVVLILGRMIRWEDTVLKFWRKHSSKLPLMNILFPSYRNSYLPRAPTERNGNSNPASLTRLICGGLILPTIATVFGKFLFQRVHSNFQRTLLGGIAFIVLKGTSKIYYRQSQYIREAHREILNYEAQPYPSNYHPNLIPNPSSSAVAVGGSINPATTVDLDGYENDHETMSVPSTSLSSSITNDEFQSSNF